MQGEGQGGCDGNREGGWIVWCGVGVPNVVWFVLNLCVCVCVCVCVCEYM